MGVQELSSFPLALTQQKRKAEQTETKRGSEYEEESLRLDMHKLYKANEFYTHKGTRTRTHTKRYNRDYNRGVCGRRRESDRATSANQKTHILSLSLLVADQRISSRRLKKSAQRRLRFHQHTVCRLRVLFSGVVVHCVCERETGTWRGEEGEGKESLSLSLSIFLFG